MPIDRYTKRAAWIHRKTRQAVRAYPQLWRKLVENWRSTDEEDALWLTYAANYLLRTAGIHWALDPFSLLTRVGNRPQPNFKQDLAPFKMVVLSHLHRDHFDPNLLSALYDLPITWVVPEFMRESVLAILPMEPARFIVPKPGLPITLGNLVLTPFEALHFNGHHGVPEMGYLAEFSGKRWLFPGDIRNYDLKALPDFGKLDGVLAHCWLGKNAALSPETDKLAGFSRFFSSMNTQKIVVSHLYEWARDARDLWTMRHFRLLRGWLRNDGFKGEMVLALTGSYISLE